MTRQKYALGLAIFLMAMNSSLQAAAMTSQQQKALQHQLNANIQYLSDENGSCLLSDQPINQAVTVIYLDPYQDYFHYDLVEALPMAKSNECIEMLGTEGLAGKYFYRVEGKSTNLIRGYGFELKFEQTIYHQRKIIGINFFGQKMAHRISECSSSEGTHFNIWQTGGAKPKKLLHRYTYLNMDLETTCKEAAYSKGLLNIK
ncbi:hypothetical protein [Acinetobacter rudis]|uniref:hypothetical protein n=1 Tax=Acinetobacter rudis TaxID=632955 RepID=UPI00333FC7AC